MTFLPPDAARAPQTTPPDPTAPGDEVFDVTAAQAGDGIGVDFDPGLEGTVGATASSVVIDLGAEGWAHGEADALDLDLGALGTNEDARVAGSFRAGLEIELSTEHAAGCEAGGLDLALGALVPPHDDAHASSRRRTGADPSRPAGARPSAGCEPGLVLEPGADHAQGVDPSRAPEAGSGPGLALDPPGDGEGRRDNASSPGVVPGHGHMSRSFRDAPARIGDAAHARLREGRDDTDLLADDLVLSASVLDDDDPPSSLGTTRVPSAYGDCPGAGGSADRGSDDGAPPDTGIDALGIDTEFRDVFAAGGCGGTLLLDFDPGIELYDSGTARAPLASAPSLPAGAALMTGSRGRAARESPPEPRRKPAAR